jgi:hypothetical protein
MEKTDMMNTQVSVYAVIIASLINMSTTNANSTSGTQLFMHGGWNNYDLRGVGWTSYAQLGIEYYVPALSGFGFGAALLVEKTDQQVDILSYHYIPELTLCGTKTLGIFFARLAIGSGLDVRVERYDGEYDDPTTPDEVERQSVPDKTEMGYTGSASLAIGVSIGKIKIGPNLTFRLQPHGMGAESGVLLHTSIF